MMLFPGAIRRFCGKCGAEYGRGELSSWELDESAVLVTTDKDGTTHENPPGIDVHIHADGARYPVIFLTDYHYCEKFGRNPPPEMEDLEGSSND